MTYNEILDRCLEKMPTDIDTREGSFIYTALAPLCFELSKAYFQIDNMLDLAFIDTSYDKYLDHIACCSGILRNSATKNRKTAEIVCSSDIINQKFSCDSFVFTVINSLDNNIYIIEAVDYGLDYNNIYGDLTSIFNLTDVTKAVILENYVLASDIESDEHLRERVKNRVFSKPYGGNIPDYEEKTLSISGIDFVKVFTANDVGIGNVHLVVGGADKAPIDNEICDICQKMFNGYDNTVAVAPIGHNISVSSCTYRDLDISLTLSIKGSANNDFVIALANSSIKKYFSELDFDNDTVSCMKAVGYLLTLDEILDISNFTINGKSDNLLLSKTSSLFEVARVNSININI